MKLSFAPRKITFKPTLWPTLATLLLLPLFIALGLWQWQRAAYKQHLVDHYTGHSHTAALSLEQALIDPEGLRYFPLKVRGHYLNDQQLLQENQFYHHQVGYFVLTPFMTDTQQLILVNRGWIPKNFASEQLQLSTQPITAEGRVSAIPTRTFHLGNNLSVGTSWPKVIQVVKKTDLSTALGQPIAPVILLLNPEQAQGFERDWQPQGLSPEKHWGYALQWFAFATLLVVLFLVLNIKKRG
jgi:surfeit locus 1 family protein